MKRVAYLGKAFNESSIMVSHTYEFLDLSISAGWWCIEDFLHIHIGWLDTFSGHSMSQIHDFFLEKGALQRLQLEIVFPESVENSPEAIQMVVQSPGVDHYVIKIYKAIIEVQLPQAVLHDALECHGGIAEAKRHLIKFVKAVASYCKRHVLLGVFIHFDLPKSGVEIYQREDSGPRKEFNGLLDTRERKRILLGYGIQSLKINTKMQSPVLLSHQNDGVAPWTLAGSDRSHLKHLFDMVSNFLLHPGVDQSISFFIWFLFEQTDLVCRQITAANFTWFQSEDVLIFFEEVHHMPKFFWVSLFKATKS